MRPECRDTFELMPASPVWNDDASRLGTCMGTGALGNLGESVGRPGLGADIRAGVRDMDDAGVVGSGAGVEGFGVADSWGG